MWKRFRNPRDDHEDGDGKRVFFCRVQAERRKPQSDGQTNGENAANQHSS
jgi:hypothetical protein